MPSLEYFLVSQSVSVDQRTNRVSAFEILQEFQPVSFPAFVPRLIALSVWVLDDGDQGKDFQATLKLSGPGLAETEFAQNFTAEGPMLRTLHHLVSVPLRGPGVLSFEIFLNGARSAGHRIKIHAADPAEQSDGLLLYAPPTVAHGAADEPNLPQRS